MSINSSSESDKKGGAEKQDTPRVFGSLQDYLTYIKANEATRVFVSVTTSPPIKSDPRADVYHVVLGANIKLKSVSTVSGKKKTYTEEKVVKFCAALDLLVVDQIAQPSKFDAMTEKALEPTLTFLKLAGFDVTRGSL